MVGIVCGPGGHDNAMPDARVTAADSLHMIKIYLLATVDICGVAWAQP